MGIRLDWEIEAEQAHIQRAGEDPATARQRRLARIRLLLFILVVLGAIGGIAALIALRLDSVNAEIERALRNTVEAEVAALRLGNLDNFSTTQRSASGDWLQAQLNLFQEYQALKETRDIQLTGQILDLEIDRNRARVAVQEIIEGVPYSHIWFYWRYDDGWRHVPPDYTFWGTLETEERQGVSVRYRTVDDDLAGALADRTENWLRTTCAAITCGPLPTIAVEIVPDEALQTSWSGNDPWLMQVPSPNTHRTRADIPFDTDLQFSVANLLATRMVDQATAGMLPVYPSDAYYLRQAVISWLVGRFVQVDTNAFVVSSLASNYGDEAVGRLLGLMQANSDATVLAEAAGVLSLDQANLDWRDYLTWRVVTEDNLIRSQDVDNFIQLYDTRDEAVRNLAYNRFSQGAPEVNKVVVAAQLETGDTADSTSLLRAVMQVGEGEGRTQQEVRFGLVEGVWKRLN